MKQKITFADALRRHVVYAYLIRYCLSLEEAHARQLREQWELTDLQIVKLGCVSMPSEIEKLIACDALAQHFNLEGIPGFYLEGNRWRLNLRFKYGILLPLRDNKMKIYGIRIFRHINDAEPRLLTSRNLPQGTPASAKPILEAA